MTAFFAALALLAIGWIFGALRTQAMHDCELLSREEYEE